MAHVAPCDFPCVSPENNDRTLCKEIRHNSTGCLWMKEQCEKCQEILEVGESETPWSPVSSGSHHLTGAAFRASSGWEFKWQLCYLPVVALGGRGVLCLVLPGSPSGVEG